MTGRVYDRRRWRRCRSVKLSRNPICEGCEERPAEHVDHIVPISAGGSVWEGSNWMALCIPCHNAKTAADKAGRAWTPPKHRGCHADGTPRDPAHPWHRADRSREADRWQPARTLKKELVRSADLSWE